MPFELAMEFTEEHYNELLGLDAGWTVTKVETDHKASRICVTVETTETSCFCAECETLSPIHDLRKAREWRHMDVMQMKCFIRCRLPRVLCPECGKVRTAEVPWSDPDRRQTLMFEAHAVEVLKASRSVEEARKLLGVSWGTLRKIMDRAVERGLERRRNTTVRYLGLDEKQFRRGHVYLSCLNDLEGGRVLEVVEGRSRESAEKLLYRTLNFRQASAVEAVAIDMWKPYEKAVRFVLGHARIVYDRYHVAAILGRAVDKVRREENAALRREDDRRLVGTKWLWLSGELGGTKLVERSELLGANLKVGRAWSIKEALRRFWDYRSKAWAGKFFDWWYGWARRSRLEPIRKAAGTLKRHLDGLLAYMDHRITNSMSEALNAKIQAVKANAKGFRSFKNLRTSILFHCGKLDLKPSLLHTHCR